MKYLLKTRQSTLTPSGKNKTCMTILENSYHSYLFYILPEILTNYSIWTRKIRVADIGATKIAVHLKFNIGNWADSFKTCFIAIIPYISILKLSMKRV